MIRKGIILYPKIYVIRGKQVMLDSDLAIFVSEGRYDYR